MVAAADTVPGRAAGTACVVGDSGIGPLRLGMTLEAARNAFQGATFARATDGEGVALVQVTHGSDTLMTLHAGEDDAEAPIDWTKAIQVMETFNGACHTPEGIHPGSLVLDVEKTLGKTTRVMRSEIEQREYIDFERMPPHLVFRIDYTGIFPEGSRESKEFDPKARIFSIAVTSFR